MGNGGKWKAPRQLYISISIPLPSGEPTMACAKSNRKEFSMSTFCKVIHALARVTRSLALRLISASRSVARHPVMLAASASASKIHRANRLRLASIRAHIQELIHASIPILRQLILDALLRSSVVPI